jgi:uncharacterized damage-inducible protein DinB
MNPLDDLVEAWQINNRVNLILIYELSEDALKATLSTRGGRDVARQLAHMHNVRVSRAGGAAKAHKVNAFEKGESPGKDQLCQAFEESGILIEHVIRQGWDNDGKVKSYRRGVITFAGYLMAHEAHHRGSILLTLKQTGHKLTDRLRWGIWDWERL